MTINNYITDPKTQRIAEVADGEESNALIVATRPLKTFIHRFKFFGHPTFGDDLNQNVGFGGTPVRIHDGGDNVQWSATAIAGTWDFASATQANSGTASIDATATINNSEAQLQAASVTLSGYTAITGWIYVTGWAQTGTKEARVTGWDTATLTQGVSVDIGQYVDTGTLGSWQKFAIPLTDMQIESSFINALRLQTISTGAGGHPNYFLDDIRLEQTGTPGEFTLGPDVGTWLYVDTVRFSFADAFSTEITSTSTLPGIDFQGILGQATLDTGIIYRKELDGSITTSLNFKDVYDWMQYPGVNISNYGTDGVNSWLTIDMKHPDPCLLKYEHSDRLTVSIAENLSGLSKFRVSIAGWEEKRS